MVKILFLWLLLGYINICAAPLVNLVKSIETKSTFESVINNWSASDDDTINLQIGFTFPFNNASYTNVWVNSNGMLSFSSSNSAYSNRSMPYTSEAQSIYPYWDDMYRRGSSTITYGTLGSGIDKRFIVSWNDVPHYPNSGRYKFQVILYANGSIRFRYDETSSTNGSSATIGVQENTSNYDQHSYNSTSTFDASKDILYSVLSADLKLLKSSCVISDPINGSVNSKRISGATIRYALEVKNLGTIAGDNVIATDMLDAAFKVDTITNLQVQDGVCDCLNVVANSNNALNGSANGENPVKLDFGSIFANTTKCGYFEVKIR